MSSPPPSVGAPRWLWLLTLLVTGVAAVPGGWAVLMFARPPSVEEEPEGMIFLGALVVLAIAVPGVACLLLAVALCRRGSGVVIGLLAVSLGSSSMLAAPTIAFLPLRLFGDPPVETSDGPGVVEVAVFEVSPDGSLVSRGMPAPPAAPEVERVDAAVNELIGSAPTRGRRTYWALPCSRTYTGIVDLTGDDVTVRLLGPPRLSTRSCRLTPGEASVRRQQLAWTVRANLDDESRRIRVRDLAPGTWTELRADPAAVGDR